MKRMMIGGFALLALAGGGNVAAATTPEATAALRVTRTTARVIRWLDGDTVRTGRGTVRLMGMDTPERGQECSLRATLNARRLAPGGSRITLVKVADRDNTDRYGRKLRYVTAPSGADVGYRLIVHGLADARYDSAATARTRAGRSTGARCQAPGPGLHAASAASPAPAARRLPPAVLALCPAASAGPGLRRHRPLRVREPRLRRPAQLRRRR